MIRNPYIGMKVLNMPFEGCDSSLYERGIIKSFSDDPNWVFVVYHCAGEWDNYKDYTAARTNVNQLQEGWTT